MRFITSKLFGPIAAAAAVLFLALAIYQTIRIDGFPFFGPGLRGQLAECQAFQGLANQKAQEAADKAREEGRLSAAADSEKLRASEVERQRMEMETLEMLQKQAANLRRPPPPVIVPRAPPPPVVLEPPPPLPAVCLLNQEALDAMQATINNQVGRRREP